MGEIKIELINQSLASVQIRMLHLGLPMLFFYHNIKKHETFGLED